MFVVKTVDELRNPVSVLPAQPPSAASDQVRPPPMPTKGSTAAQMAQYERDRITRHMNGEYVFPPLRIDVPVSEPCGDTSHRRSRPFVCPVRTDNRFSYSSDRTVTQESLDHDGMSFRKVALH